jgi:GntR family transcriptional regulator, galactonate operon transcriptional repressor
MYTHRVKAHAWTADDLAARPARLSEVVIGLLVDRIVSGEHPVGGLIPREPELCAAFGVSRTVIREALKVLEEKGLVRVRRGFGTVVNDEDEWNLLDLQVLSAVVRHDRELEVLDDLIEVRVALETDMAARAARSRDDADLARMRTLLGEMAGQLDTPDQFLATDVRFHDAIMLASGNRLSRAVVRAIHSQARASTRYNGEPRRSDLEMTHGGHLALLDRIVAQDAEGAAAAMREHILGTWAERKAQRPARDG